MDGTSTMRGDRSVISVCEALGDRISYAVLLSIMKSPKSASEICIESNLPISSTYKALKKLQHVDLIKASLVDRDGRRLSVFKPKVKLIKVTVAARDVKVDLVHPELDFSSSDEIEIKAQEN